eukprot:sb/3474050/
MEFRLYYPFSRTLRIRDSKADSPKECNEYQPLPGNRYNSLCNEGVRSSGSGECCPIGEFCGGNEDDCTGTVYEQGPYEEPVLLAVDALAHTLHRMVFPRNTSEDLDACVLKAKPIHNTEGAGDLFYLRNSPLGSCLYNKLITG